MMHDPFERFEVSRFGLAIPIALFVIGAFATWLAYNSLLNLDDKIRSRQNDAPPSSTEVMI